LVVVAVPYHEQYPLAAAAGVAPAAVACCCCWLDEPGNRADTRPQLQTLHTALQPGSRAWMLMGPTCHVRHAVSATFNATKLLQLMLII
jgi:hypothetical protein